jgi:antitoxin component YwqK of YwqJK toxin-antitoxin module
MKCVTIILLVYAWAWLSGLAAAQEAPRPPFGISGTPTPLQPEANAGPIGKPTPAESTGDEPTAAEPTPLEPPAANGGNSPDAPERSLRGRIGEGPESGHESSDMDSRTHEPQVEAGKPAPLPDAGAADASPEGQVQTELITERYPNRRLKIERSVVQDAERNYVNHGQWTMWAADGTMIAKGRYEWGKRQGQWSRLYTDIKDDRIAGQHTKQFTAPLAGVADFVDDKLHGTWKIVDAKQRDVRSWEFKHGKLHGKAISWFPTGHKQSETTFEDGMMTGTAWEWDAAGKLLSKINYRDGRSSQPYVKSFPSGERQYEGHYLGPRQVYKTTIDFWNGIVEIQLSKKEGSPKRHGKWIEWYENGGKKFEGDFDDDKATGHHTWWYQNGQKRAEGDFKAGKENGHWTWWHENGLKHLDGLFANGVQTGTWVRWKPDGKVQEVQEHHLGPAKPGEPKPLTADGLPQVEPLPADIMPTPVQPTPVEPIPSVRRPTPRPVPQAQPQRAQSNPYRRSPR